MGDEVMDDAWDTGEANSPCEEKVGDTSCLRGVRGEANDAGGSDCDCCCKRGCNGD